MRTLNYALTMISLFVLSQTTLISQVRGPVNPATDPANGTPAPWPDIIPPSPNAAALGEYGKVPVGLFTGTIQQNIPLYTIQTANYSLPISLSYRSNGTRVSDMGSDVGLGWVLNAGGVITRTLNDEPDELGSFLTLPSVPFESSEMSTFLKDATNVNNKDSEHDMFAFNFGNYSGKFYVTGAVGSMQAVCIDPTPIKIDLLAEFYSTTVGSKQIKITDPEGIVYFFGGPNAVESGFSRTYNSGNTSEFSKSKITKNAWYLSQIILQNGEEINFTYSVSGTPSNGSLSVYDGGISQSVYGKLSNFSGNDYPAHAPPLVSNISSDVFKLTKIEWKSGRIDLAYTPRFIGGLTDMEKLENLTVFSKNGTITTPLQVYDFDYLVAAANPAYNNPQGVTGSYLENSQRLFLTAIIAQSPGGGELNRHTFEYYNTSELPHRFSYSQDYWGYFNGAANPDLIPRDLSNYNPAYYQTGGSFTQAQIQQLYANVGGDRAPHYQYAINGMLKKVTYPTGGYSAFEYESHDYGTVTFQPPTQPKISVNIGHFPDETITVATTAVIPFDQNDIQLLPTIQGCPHEPNNNVSFDLYITEAASGVSVPVKLNNQLLSTPVTISLGVQANYTVSLKKGKSYKFQMIIHSTCVDYLATLSFSYYDVDGTYSYINVPVGGVRLSRIATGDLTGNEQIKRLYYGNDFSCLTCSSGSVRQIEPGIDYYENFNNGDYSLKVNLTSNSLHDLYDKQGNHIVYAVVTEGYGDNFEGGATVHYFNNIVEIPPVNFRDPVLGTSFTNVFGRGEEVKTIYYKKNSGSFVKVKEINNTYVNDNRLNRVSNEFRATIRSWSNVNLAQTYNLSTYSVNTQWRYLSASSEITYDQNGNNGCSVGYFYEYGNPVHMQLTSSSTILENPGLSNQRAFQTKIYYPSDYTFPGTVSGTAAVIKSMATDKHIWSKPVEKLNYTIIGSNYRLTGGGLSTYKFNGTSVVKDKDYSLKFNNSTIYQDMIGVTPSSVNASGQFIYDSHYEQLNAYNRYDAVNNMLEIADRKLTAAVIVQPGTESTWAKADNCTYASVAYSSFEHDASTSSSFTNWNYNAANINTTNYQSGTRSYTLSGGNITTIQSLSSSQKYKVSLWRKVGSGSTLTLTAGGSSLTQITGPQRNGWQYIEATFTGATSVTVSGNYIIDELRLYPVNARMTSYVYKDGVGVISQCNENNQHTFFEYDEFNRLKLVKDQDGNILKKNEYKYQHIQN